MSWVCSTGENYNDNVDIERIVLIYSEASLMGFIYFRPEILLRGRFLYIVSRYVIVHNDSEILMIGGGLLRREYTNVLYSPFNILIDTRTNRAVCICVVPLEAGLFCRET